MPFVRIDYDLLDADEYRRLVDVPEVIGMLRTAVEDFGPRYVSKYARYVATAGGYFPFYQPRFKVSCIVGHVLHRVGVPLAALTYMPLPGQVEFTSMTPVRFTEEAEMLLAHAMTMNDNHEPWGAILERLETGWKRGDYAPAA